MLLGVDVGGTFTDAVLFDGSDLYTAKEPTTPGEEATGVLNAVGAVLEKADREASEVESFVHGMTVGTNALLEERGARVALVTNAGFEDVLEIGRQDRPELYRLCAPKPAPLAPASDRVGVTARMGPGGEVTPLADDHATEVANAIGGEVESAAVCLLFSYVDPSHERRIADAIRERLPEMHVSLSSDVLPRFREYERTSTTVIDAYLSPLLGRYLGALAEAADDRGLPAPDIMRSSGGIAPWREAAERGSSCVLSGPAGGAVGAALIARTDAGGAAVGLDMGGTSCDVCVVEDGEVGLTDSREISGRPIQLPMVDVHTVGAGGGSIAWMDDGGALKVGPRSAGARPGPACYGNGGEEPTVTDANLILGRLAADSRLAGDVALDVDAAEAAVSGLADKLDLEPVETAIGILRLANAEMARAIRVVTVNRGIDPRSFALLPFGGAGPMHAADLAAEMGMKRIVVPRAGGVLSAFGMLASPRRRDTARTVMLSGSDLEADRIREEVEELRDAISEGMEDAEEEVTFELRYEGQSFELPITAAWDAPVAELGERFAKAHEARYGFCVDDAAVELVAISLALIGDRAEPVPAAADADATERTTRRVRFGSEWHEAEVIRGEPTEGTALEGPGVFELPESTLVVPPGWSAQITSSGSIVAEVSG